VLPQGLGAASEWESGSPSEGRREAGSDGGDEGRAEHGMRADRAKRAHSEVRRLFWSRGWEE
jgi:hypothetical protein